MDSKEEKCGIGRKMPWLIVAMSMFASLTSAISFMGLPGLAYKENCAQLTMGFVGIIAASSLPRIAGEFNMGFKEHNADYLSASILSLHPEYGITCANVGPSFAAAQTRALLDLAGLEEKKMGKVMLSQQLEMQS